MATLSGWKCGRYESHDFRRRLRFSLARPPKMVKCELRRRKTTPAPTCLDCRL